MHNGVKVCNGFNSITKCKPFSHSKYSEKSPGMRISYKGFFKSLIVLHV